MDTDTPLPLDERTVTTPMEHADEADSKLEAIPGMEVCDFCMSPEVRWSYPCGEVRTETTVSTDSWAACDPCHDLIEADDHAGLLRRALARIGEQLNLARDELVVAAPDVADLQRQFLANRGDATPDPWDESVSE